MCLLHVFQTQFLTNSLKLSLSVVIKADTVVERQVHRDKHLYRGAKPQLGRETEECMEGEPILQQVYTDRLPLLGEFDSGSVEEEPEPEADIDREMVDQQIGTIAVNLKVSWELLQQASRSLDTVEKHHRGEEQLDSCSASSISSFSMSSTNLSGFSTAVGPHLKQYSLLPHRGDHWAKNLEAQFLSKDWELLKQEELALWLSHYPAQHQQYEQGWLMAFLSSACYMTESHSVGVDHSTEELSQYRSALDDSFFNILSGKKQQQVHGFTHQNVVLKVFFLLGTHISLY